MRPPNDVPDEMRIRWLDRETADRLVTGHLDPDDATPGYQEVAALMRAVSAPPAQAELALEHQATAAASLLTREGSRTVRRQNMRAKLSRLKLAGVVAVGTLLATSGLAVAGTLPDAAQDFASDALARVGISVPAGSSESATVSTDISEIATTTDASGLEKGAEISTAASDGLSQAGQHAADEAVAAAQGAAVVDTPNGGGTSTADEASGGMSEAGTDIADEASGGASEDGSGNAPTPVPTATDLPTP